MVYNFTLIGKRTAVVADARLIDWTHSLARSQRLQITFFSKLARVESCKIQNFSTHQSCSERFLVSMCIGEGIKFAYEAERIEKVNECSFPLKKTIIYLACFIHVVRSVMIWLAMILNLNNLNKMWSSFVSLMILKGRKITTWLLEHLHTLVGSQF